MKITSDVISKEQPFKGRLIDEAVESVYDLFHEALAEGKDVTLLQTNFCKENDYVNHKALLHIFKGLMLPQAIFVVKRSSKCLKPGSPIFVIVFDLLLVSLKKNHDPQNLSGFMPSWDDPPEG